jgi:histidyl-tRNA synthetase
MNESSLRFFDDVKAGLTRLGIPFDLNTRLVRGLDYYTHTTFEFVTTDLGSQGAVIAGGRYDGLMAMMGGPDIPGVGWASGVERLSMLLDGPPPRPSSIAIVPIGAAAEARADSLAHELRHAGFTIDMAFKGKPGQRMKRADRIGARLAISMGDEELAAGRVRVRELDTGADHDVGLGGLEDWLRARLAA